MGHIFYYLLPIPSWSCVPIQNFINSNFQTVVTQHLHMLQGGSHVSRSPILLLGNIIYPPCHVLLNVRIKVKKKTTQNISLYCELGPPVVIVKRFWVKERSLSFAFWIAIFYSFTTALRSDHYKQVEFDQFSYQFSNNDHKLIDIIYAFSCFFFF